jgi:hypothetical protein
MKIKIQIKIYKNKVKQNLFKIKIITIIKKKNKIIKKLL